MPAGHWERTKLTLVGLVYRYTCSLQVYSLSKANEVHMFGIYVGKLYVNKQEDLETRLH